MRHLNSSSAAVLASALLAVAAAPAATTSINSGTLGAAGNGTNSDLVELGLPGPLADPNDTAVSYGGGTNNQSRTLVPHNAALNPSATSPFTIEFWAKPSLTDNDDTPVFNRVSASPRAGWVFFQRNEATGWNFRMYNGNGSDVGHDITGGPYTLNTWTHVVAVWDGTSPKLFVNGVDTAAVNIGLGGYNVNTSASFSVGSYDNGSASFNGLVDETAFYSTALSPAQILGHYNAAADPTPGAYAALVQGDGAVLYLRNAQVPEPASAGLVLLGLAGILRRRR
jgi:hypothetical protein